MSIFSKLTPKALRAVAIAGDRARTVRQYVGTQQLLFGIVEVSDRWQKFFVEHGVTRQALYTDVVSRVPITPRSKKPSEIPLELPFEESAKDALAMADKLSGTVSTAHLLLALVDDEQFASVRYLERLGCDIHQLKRDIASELERTGITDDEYEAPPALSEDEKLLRMVEMARSRKDWRTFYADYMTATGINPDAVAMKLQQD